LSGVIGFALGDSLYFAAFPLAGVQATAMMGNLVPPIAGLLSWMFLGEVFDLQALLWMAVVLAGVSLVILDPKKSSRNAEGAQQPKHLAAGLAVAFGAALCQGGSIVIAHASFQGVEIIPGTLVRLIGGLVAGVGIAALISLFPKGRRSGAGLAETMRPLRDLALCRALVLPTFFATLVCLPLHSVTVQLAPGHLSALLLSTSPLFILPLGFRFGVRQGPLSVLGTLIGFGGVVGLVWTS
jgi:drug/metabolite transporter (DMT)-like permease